MILSLYSDSRHSITTIVGFAYAMTLELWKSEKQLALSNNSKVMRKFDWMNEGFESR